MIGVAIVVLMVSVRSPVAVNVMVPADDCAALLFVFVRPREVATSAAVTGLPSEKW